MISFDDIKAGDPLHHASGDGRNFAVAGGVANAVVNAIHQIDPGLRGQCSLCTGTRRVP